MYGDLPPNRIMLHKPRGSSSPVFIEHPEKIKFPSPLPQSCRKIHIIMIRGVVRDL
jgi:hypothetical protein